jgi:hypothetical protein
MATQVTNVMDQDAIDTLRRELHGNVFTETAHRIGNTSSDIASFVTEPAQEVWSNPEVRFFVLGTIFGIITQLIP